MILILIIINISTFIILNFKLDKLNDSKIVKVVLEDNGVDFIDDDV